MLPGHGSALLSSQPPALLSGHPPALLFPGIPGAPELMIVLLIMVLVFVPTALLIGAGAVGGYLLWHKDDDEPPVDADGLLSDIDEAADATDEATDGTDDETERSLESADA